MTKTATTTRRCLTVAQLTETMCRLTESLRALRSLRLRTPEGTVLALANARMIAADEAAHHAAQVAYRDIRGARAMVPARCRGY